MWNRNRRRLAALGGLVVVMVGGLSVTSAAADAPVTPSMTNVVFTVPTCKAATATVTASDTSEVGDRTITYVLSSGRGAEDQATVTSGATIALTSRPMALGEDVAFTLTAQIENGGSVASTPRVIARPDDCPAGVRLKASNSTITVGQSVTLSWSSDNATSLTASGAWSGSKKVPAGSQTLTPADPGTFTYTLAAKGDGGSKSASVSVVVEPKCVDGEVAESGACVASASPSPTASDEPRPSADPVVSDGEDAALVVFGPTVRIAGMVSAGAVALLFVWLSIRAGQYGGKFRPPKR